MLELSYKPARDKSQHPIYGFNSTLSGLVPIIHHRFRGIYVHNKIESRKEFYNTCCIVALTVAYRKIVAWKCKDENKRWFLNCYIRKRKFIKLFLFSSLATGTDGQSTPLYTCLVVIANNYNWGLYLRDQCSKHVSWRKES